MANNNGPLARNPATGKIERMVEEKYRAKVWDRPSECNDISCIQNTGDSICKTTCPLWETIKARKKEGLLKFKMKERTRFVFKEVIVNDTMHKR